MIIEKLMVNKSMGELMFYGFGNYKVFGIKNIFKEFNVMLLKDVKGERRFLYFLKVDF